MLQPTRTHRSSLRYLTALAAGSLVAVGVAPACTSSSGPGGSAGGSGGAATGGSSVSGRSAVNGGSNLGGSAGTSQDTGGTGITISVGESGAAGADDTGSAGVAGAAGAPSLDPNEACALSTDTVEAIPSVLQLVIDTSGSMDWPPGWAPV